MSSEINIYDAIQELTEIVDTLTGKVRQQGERISELRCMFPVPEPAPGIYHNILSSELLKLQEEAKIGRMVMNMPEKSKLERTEMGNWFYDTDCFDSMAKMFTEKTLLEVLTKGGLTDDSNSK